MRKRLEEGRQGQQGRRSNRQQLHHCDAWSLSLLPLMLVSAEPRPGAAPHLRHSHTSSWPSLAEPTAIQSPVALNTIELSFSLLQE